MRSWHILPGVFGSFSVSLLCGEPIDEQEKVGERMVGDLGVPVPINNIKILSLNIRKTKEIYQEIV